MIAIFRKEINLFFSSAVGLLTVLLFLLVNGMFIWIIQSDFNVLDYGYANLDAYFTLAPILFLLFIPAICMRFFADEYRLGTIEILLTKPLSVWHIVIGKFLAAIALVILAILPTFLYFFTVYYFGETIGNVDVGGTFGSYIGLFLLATTFVSISVFASSLSQNQIVAFLVAIFLNTIFYYGFDIISQIEPLQQWDFQLRNLGIQLHYETMSKGILDTRDIIYFLSVFYLFLLLCKSIIQQKRK